MTAYYFLRVIQRRRSQQGLVASSRHINWTVDDVKAGFQCQFYLPASGSLQGEAAEIVCQTF